MSKKSRHASHSSHEHHSHTTYYVLYVVLMLLMVLTVWVAYLHLGALAFPIAIAIAVLKSTLVILFFMHVAEGSPLIRVFAASGFVWLLIMVIGFLTDYIANGKVPWEF